MPNIYYSTESYSVRITRDSGNSRVFHAIATIDDAIRWIAIAATDNVRWELYRWNNEGLTRVYLSVLKGRKAKWKV